MNWCQNGNLEITIACLFNNVTADNTSEFDTVTLTNEFFNLHDNTSEGTITEMTDTTINDIIWQSNTVNGSRNNATHGDMINSDDVDFSVEFFNITDGISKLKN